MEEEHLHELRAIAEMQNQIKRIQEKLNERTNILIDKIFVEIRPEEKT